MPNRRPASDPPGAAQTRGPRRVRAGFVVAVLAAALAAAYLWWPRSGRLDPHERLNVLLVTIDTLRADAVGAYGNPSASTPAMDALAARGARFSTSVAHVPLTGPSHASILTGLIPVRHGVRDNGGFVLPAAVPVMTERFRGAGYRTAAFVSGYPLVRRFGFARGFETYDDALPHGNDPRRAPYVERSADRTTDRVLAWLDAPAGETGPGKGGGPFFVWVHYYDPHAPYEPHGVLSSRFAGRPYYGEAAFVDQQLERLLRRLDERGLVARTLVLVTSDHGESLGEHGEETHGIFVYDSTLRIPWIMAGPGIPPGGIVDVPARLVDVAPTLLDFAGIAGSGDSDGRSLRAASAGRPVRDEPAYAESLSSLLHMGWAPLHAWRSQQWKLIEAPRLELYDLQKDPAEAHNLAPERPDLVEQMRRPLQAAMSAPTPVATMAVDAEAAERLRALGYLGGASVAPADGAGRKDPKDHTEVITRLERGMSQARMDPASAVRDLSAVLRLDPGITVARRYRAVAYAAAGRPEAALEDLQALEQVEPLSAEDLIVLSDCLRAAERSEEALRALERAARLQPNSPQPPLSRGNILLKEGRHEEAATAFEAVLSVAPDHIEALRGLGDLALLRGDTRAAAERYGRILAADPNDTGAMVKLGVIRMRDGAPDEATSLFRKAVEKEPTNAEALLYLAGALSSRGRHAEAVPFFERALAAGPKTTMALNGLALTLIALGDRPAAAKALRDSLALDPRQPGVARTLAEIRTTAPAR